MKKNIPFMIWAVVILLTLAASQTPELRCVENNDPVCVNCYQTGTCVLDPSSGGFSVQNATECEENQFCDDSHTPYGKCFRYSTETSACPCDGNSSCIGDPNNENVFIKCEDSDNTMTGGAFFCEQDNVFLDLCICSLNSSSTSTEISSTSPSTEILPTSESLSTSKEIPSTSTSISSTEIPSTSTSISSTEIPSTTTSISSTEIPSTSTSTEIPSTLTSTEIPSTLTSTEIPSTLTSTEIPSTSTSTLTSTEISSSSTEIPATSTEIPSTLTSTEIPSTLTSTEIPSTLTLTEISSTSTSTEIPSTSISTSTLTSTEISSSSTEISSTSTSTEIPSASTSTKIPPTSTSTEIPSTLTSTEIPTTVTSRETPSTITDKSTAEATTTTTTTTTTATTTVIPCPENCPFVVDPNGEDCTNFLACIDGENVPGQCPSDFCFDQDLCQCTPTYTTTPISCPDGCRFVKDPSDNCTKYFLCSSDGNIPYNCPSSKCFDQTSCGCVEQISTLTTTTTSTTTTPTPTITISTPMMTTTTTTSTTQGPITCPPGCPFVENPSGGCGNFFICNDGILIPGECPGTLCFDQVACECD